jgi:uncharacterized protein YycO
MKLNPGDILIYRVVPNSPWHDKLIAWGEKIMGKKSTPASYCHVAMVDYDTDLILEAVWPKTHVTKFPGKDLNPVEVYRVKGATLEQINIAIDWAHENLGLWYNIGLLFFGLFPKKHEVVCSTYIDDAWDAAGLSLGEGKLLSPDEVAASPRLERVLE